MTDTQTKQLNPKVLETQYSLIRKIYDYVPTDKNVINLGLGELPFPVPQAVKKAVRSALTNGGNLYTKNTGLPTLRKAIADDFNSRNQTNYDTESIIVTAGTTEAMFALFFVFATQGNRILIPEIGYTAYASDAQLLGLDIQMYKLKEDMTIDTHHLEKLLKDKEGLTLLVLNSPSNPTGQVLSKETLERIAALSKKNDNVFILSDEIYSTFLYDDYNHLSIARFLPERTIVIDGVSKRASMTGYRVGWIVGPTKIIEQVTKVHSFIVTAASTLSQYAALPVLHGECEQEIKIFRAALRQNRDIMIKELTDIPAITFTKPNGAFYCFVDITAFGSSWEVTKKILQQTGVVTTPGLAFGKAGDSYIRLSFAGSYSDITEGMKKIRQFLST